MNIKTPNNITDYTSQALAQMLKASGDTLRLEILRVLSNDSYGVLELTEIFETKQSGLSHHLKVLAKAGLVSNRREGNSLFYRRNPLNQSEPFFTLKKALFESADQLTLNDKVQERIQCIQERRSQTSQAFFADLGADFKEQQELIAAFDVYGKPVEDLLKSINLPNHDSILEIGPGAGEFLDVLARAFKSVTALDNSENMLDRAQSNNQHHSNITYIHGDTSVCTNRNDTYDCVISNMVLHHTPSPVQIFKDVSLCLKEQGSFIVCDLTQHDQDWARTACGDQWLGFAPADFSEWAKENQLKEGQSDYFALRNGFQIQIRQFIKQSY